MVAPRPPPGPARIAQWLRHCPMFSHIGAPLLATVAGESSAATHRAGTRIFDAGAPADGFYLVVHGSVSLHLPGPGGAEKVIELVGAGECFGQAAMFMQIPFPVAARCQTETLVVKVPRAVVFGLIDTDPAIARKMLAGMSLRLHRLVHDIEGYAFRTAASRIADYLLHAAGEAPSLRLPMSKQELASKLLVTRETLSRVLTGWVADGTIAMRGRDITLLDPAAMAAIARCDRP